MPWTNPQARDLVIRTLLGEGDGTPEGQIAVAHVIKTRADSSAWGDPFKGGLTHAITAYKQFSMWNKDDPKLVALANRVNAIPTTDPRYQRAAAVADGVFGNDIPDNTGGATNYHATTVSPDWARGQPRKFIGSQYFYKLPFTAANTAGTAVVSPSTVGQGGSVAPAPAPAPAPTPAAAPAATSGQFGPNDVYKNIPAVGEHGEQQLPMFMRWNPDPVGNDQKNFAALNPDIQRVIAQARTDNPNLSFVIGNGTRSAQDQDWAKSVGWSKVGSKDGGDALVHMQGRAVDLWGLDKDGHVQFDPAQQQQISVAMKNAAAKLGVPINWGGDWQSFKDAQHFELQGQGSAVAAGAEGPTYVAPTLPASARPMGEGGGPTPYGIVKETPTTPNPNAPAAQAQPVAATAPAGAASTPGPAANPAAGFVGPGSDKVSLVKSITSGTSHNPQLTTAANWGNLFGGATPLTPPAAAPAAAAPAAPASAPTVPPGAPVNQPPGSPASSILPAWGATTPIDSNTIPAAVPPYMPGSGLNGEPAATQGAPSMGFPAMTNPFGQPQPDQQVSMLPGSMLASAQDLIRRLFPSNVG